MSVSVSVMMPVPILRKMILVPIACSSSKHAGSPQAARPSKELVDAESPPATRLAWPSRLHIAVVDVLIRDPACQPSKQAVFLVDERLQAWDRAAAVVDA
eukprot:1363445-Rhodomonas_salina.1